LISPGAPRLPLIDIPVVILEGIAIPEVECGRSFIYPTKEIKPKLDGVPNSVRHEFGKNILFAATGSNRKTS
jgi:hypothetical protein